MVLETFDSSDASSLRVGTEGLPDRGLRLAEARKAGAGAAQPCAFARAFRVSGAGLRSATRSRCQKTKRPGGRVRRDACHSELRQRWAVKETLQTVLDTNFTLHPLCFWTLFRFC